MEQYIEGSFIAHSHRIAIITSRCNNFITSKLLDGAKDCLYRHGVSSKNITIVLVPGAFELSLVAQKLAQTGNFSAIICLGAIIRGETPHFDQVCNAVVKGITEVSLTVGLPIAFGVLTTDTIEQAISRTGTRGENKGWKAALSAIEMCNIVANINSLKSSTRKAK